MNSIPCINSADLHRPSANLEIILFNVGQGDHILLKFPSGKYGIIDFYHTASYGLPEPPALTYFRHLQTSLPPEEFAQITLAFVCISHTDKDHVKGVAKCLKWFADNNVFIEDFWLGGAQDEKQLLLYLKEKIPAFVHSLAPAVRLNLEKALERYKDNLSLFFTYFEHWKTADVKSADGTIVPKGSGEYLVDIKELRKPCLHPEIRAINMGPLSTHVEEYTKTVTLDILKKILNMETGDSETDKNLVSHILRFQFGERNLLFGGDTHREIWTACLARYADEHYSHFRHFGSFAAHFIKVSHHGSRYSSCEQLWKDVLPNGGDVFLAISAGRHKKYLHPHSETLRHIRTAQRNAKIFATNVCHACLPKCSDGWEWHKWYDDILTADANRARKKAGPRLSSIQMSFRLPDDRYLPSATALDPDKGLLAYIFEIPASANDPIRVRTALSKSVKMQECAYQQHEEALFPEECCGKAV